MTKITELGLRGQIASSSLCDVPGLGVQGAERFVHQQDLGVDGERAGDGGALHHAAGKRGVVGQVDADGGTK